VDPLTAGVVAVVALALLFAVTNGFHDTANAIATSVATRALTPAIAVRMAAVANLVGAFLGFDIALRVGQDIVDLPIGAGGLSVLVAALVAAICWNLLTWWKGMPTSSTHALIGGLLGAAVVGDGQVLWGSFGVLVVLPLLISPLVGFGLAYAVLLAVLWWCRRMRPDRVERAFRVLQTGSATALALGHGLQDAPKAMAVVVLGLAAAGMADGTSVPLWVAASCAVAMALGTAMGGWRIVRTLGAGLVRLDTPRGFAAESTAAAVLYVGGLAFSAPLSTTHTVASALVGVGVTRGWRGVRWRIALDVVSAWLLTVPATAAIAAAVVLGLDALA
jgi:PiT family inorganic phosphate transporter